MTTKDDGGPVYPVQDCGAWQCHGISLRDYAAIKAMASILIRPTLPVRTGESIEETVARLAYEQADAMLEARKK